VVTIIPIGRSLRSGNMVDSSKVTSTYALLEAATGTATGTGGDDEPNNDVTTTKKENILKKKKEKFNKWMKKRFTSSLKRKGSSKKIIEV
jgi:hypothetical protein